MLSLGTDDFFAFWMASYRVGLPAGSPPPVRAATSMFLMSRANSLPRLASTTAFLCFVVAHLEWPDINQPPGPRQPHAPSPRSTGARGDPRSVRDGRRWRAHAAGVRPRSYPQPFRR